MAHVGRPTVMTEEVIAKLEDAFLDGASDKESIFWANISKDAFYDYCKENPEFTERIEDLRDSLKLKAKKNIAKGINEGDRTLSQWYLERKVKHEFSQRTETDITTKGEKFNFDETKAGQITKEFEKKLKESL